MCKVAIVKILKTFSRGTYMQMIQNTFNNHDFNMSMHRVLLIMEN